MEKPKVLYVSDSLGTPIHPRGIFNYSVALIEILRQLGYHVTLVVEKIAGYGVPDGMAKAFGTYSSDAVSSAQLAEIYRYFNERHFHFNWRYQTKLFRTIVEEVPALARLIQRGLATRQKGTVVENRMSRLDFVPAKGEHLTKMDAFTLIDYFYSSSMSRAVNNLEPIGVDATGYDLVVVDTPHYVKVTGIDPNRILAVIHDLIPLRDPTMGEDWRRLFIKKMEATLSLDSNIIFVSEYTQAMFHLHFPTRKPRREAVLYPSIRSTLMAAAATSRDTTNVLRKLYARRAKEQAFHTRPATPEADAGTVRRPVVKRVPARTEPVPTEGVHPPASKVRPIRSVVARWDQSQPYFVTAASDEPRKNIGILVEAFRPLRGKANMIVIGQIDERRYLGDRPQDHPNICFTGFIPEADKIDLIRRAEGMIFSSFSEGFGIPIVEGAVLGVPVLCSDIAVFREIAGELGTYFNPGDPETLTAAIERSLDSREVTRERAATLRERVVARFSQAAMAQRLRGTLKDMGAPMAAEDPAALPQAANAA